MNNSNHDNQKNITLSKKQELEEKKLQLEIIELQRPWFQKPTFLVPIVGALSSIFILWITGFFNTKIESLTTKRELLSIETHKLENTKAALIIDSINLLKTKITLQKETEILNNKMKSISNENDSIKAALIINSAKIQNIVKTNNLLISEISKKKRELKIISDSLKVSTKPNLLIGFSNYTADDTIDIGLYVINGGSGTAYFKDIKFFFRGQEYRLINNDCYTFFDQIVQAFGISMYYIKWECRWSKDDINSAGTLTRGEKISLIQLIPSRVTTQVYNKFLEDVNGLEIEIVYQSSDGTQYIRHKTFGTVDTGLP